MATKRKCVSLSVSEKLKLIEKLESGVSVTNVCAEYGIAKQTVSDIRKKKDKLQKFALQCDVEKTVASRKRLKLPSDINLEAAVHKWYVQQRSSGVAVRGVELQAAANRLAKHLNIEFKASDGWLYRFRSRHGIVNKRMFGEAMSADKGSVEPFKKRLHTIIEEEELTHAQLYNADETGLFWRALPENTQAYKHEGTVPGQKLSKERLSALLCANADGSHRLKSVVVGKSRRPRVLKNILDDLPLHYTHSKNAWFTQEITNDWFHKHFIPEVKRFQVEVLKIDSSDVKALLLVDNAPSHSIEKMCSNDGKIKCLALPPNTTSLIQPMDQGVILTCKRLYKRKFLDEVMVVLEEPQDKVEDTRGQRTLQNIRNYNIKSAIFNWSSAWSEVKTSTLVNCWNKLLLGTDVELNFEGCEVRDYHQTLLAGGETGPTEENIAEWLDEEGGDAGYHIQTEEEIARDVLSPTTTEQDMEEEDLQPMSKAKLSSAREALDTLIGILDSTSDSELQPFYSHFRTAREIIIKKQQKRCAQEKIDRFFKPLTPQQNMFTVSNQSPSCSYDHYETVCVSDPE